MAIKKEPSEKGTTKVTFDIDKSGDFPEWYEEIVKVAGIVDNRYPVKGMIVWKPYGYKALKLMLRIMETLLDKYGHQEAYFPMLIPESIFKKESDFLEGFGGDSYIVTQVGNTKLTEKLYIRPTSETVMYEMFKLWIRSKSDLPLKLYQTVNIFRYETKQSKAILRVREIVKFKEAHTCHATMEGADRQIEEGIQIYREFFDSLLIPYIVLRTPKWDTFAGAEYNYDLLTVMPDGKAIELGSIINLGNKYAEVFDIKYEKEDGSYEHVYQTCYGISERALAVAFSIHGDTRGAIFPPCIAPVQVVIVPIIFKGKEASTLEKCVDVKKRLEERGFRVKIDDSARGPGDKFYHWETKGVPIRVEIGPRDLEKNRVVVARRDTFKKTRVEDEKMVEVIGKTNEMIDEELRCRAEKYLAARIVYFKGLDDFKKDYSERVGIIALPWCGDDACGVELEKAVDIPALGYVPDEPIDEKCPMCGSTDNVRWLYFGRTY